jgi:hypothetical protein
MMLYAITEAAQKKAGTSSGIVEGKLAIRYLPILEVLQFITEMLLKLRFKEGIFNYAPVAVSVDQDAQVLKDTFRFIQAFKDRFPILKCGLKGRRLCRTANNKALGIFYKHGTITYYNRKDNQKWVIKNASCIIDAYLGMQIERSESGYHIEGLRRGCYWPSDVFGNICPGCDKQCRNSGGLAACLLKCDYAKWKRLTPLWGNLWDDELLKSVISNVYVHLFFIEEN